MNKSSRQQINKEVVFLNDTLDQLDFIEIDRGIHLKNSKIHILFKYTQAFSMIDYMLGQKTNFDKFKRIETISRNFFWLNNGVELVINYKKENGKPQKYMDTK